jgi:hypothetical protein
MRDSAEIRDIPCSSDTKLSADGGEHGGFHSSALQLAELIHESFSVHTNDVIYLQNSGNMCILIISVHWTNVNIT